MDKTVLIASFLLMAIPGYGQAPDTTVTSGNHLNHLYRYVGYPAQAEDAGIEGTVVVGFDVDTVCRITNKRILTGIGYGCDERALKCIGDEFELALMKENKFTCRVGMMSISIRFALH